MALSKDPEKRARQLANLRPGAGKWDKGATPHLKHGLRSRRPDRLLLGETGQEIIDALGAQVPLRDRDGQPLPEFTTAIEIAALQLVVVRRVMGYLQTHGWEDERGNLRPEAEGVERALNRLRRHLDGLGATPASYARLGFEVASAEAASRRSAEDVARQLTEEELEARLVGLDRLAGDTREPPASKRPAPAEPRPQPRDADDRRPPRTSAAERRRQLAPGRPPLDDLRNRINDHHEED